MEKNKDITKLTLNDEQQAYIDSFAQAMKEVEAEYRRRRVVSKTVTALKREGKWNAEYLSLAFVEIVAKKSPLSHIQREYILSLGALARSIYDRQHMPAPAEDNNNNDNQKAE